MAFDVGSESKPRKLFTGLADVQVIAINPTQAEAGKLGLTFKEEPTYMGVNDETNAKKIRLDFWVKATAMDYPTKMTLFVEDTAQVSSTGKSRFINDYGQNTYAEAEQNVLDLESKGRKWFKPDGLRVARVGECELVEFIRAWMSIGQEGKARIDSISKLVNGDLSEIKPLITRYAERKVQLLLTVREYEGNWFQNVYSRYFSRAGNTKTLYWDTHIKGVQTKPMFQDSFKLQEFDPLSVQPDAAPNAPTAIDTPWNKIS